jgi:hypothetical protein
MTISAVFMATLAASAVSKSVNVNIVVQGGILIPAAATTCVYTAASVNNAFEARGNPLFRVLGSHVSKVSENNSFCRAQAAAIINVLMIVISLKTAPTSP